MDGGGVLLPLDFGFAQGEEHLSFAFVQTAQQATHREPAPRHRGGLDGVVADQSPDPASEFGARPNFPQAAITAGPAAQADGQAQGKISGRVVEQSAAVLPRAEIEPGIHPGLLQHPQAGPGFGPHEESLEFPP